MEERLDRFLVDRGYTTGRDRAKELIAKGQIYLNGAPATKASVLVSDQDLIEVQGERCPYVSRGGYKLEKALASFSVQSEGKICMDIGASSGGFTDCLLQHGAQKVYAVDVGTDQLSPKLRQDSRVVVMEQTNIRTLELESLAGHFQLITVDVSFLSITHVLAAAFKLLSEGGVLVGLIKPQFEAGPKLVGKKGVVKDLAVHVGVLKKICGEATALSFSLRGLDYSPIKGPEGNVEYLVCLEKSDRPSVVSEEQIEDLPQTARENL